jgi:hypothetical protein
MMPNENVSAASPAQQTPCVPGTNENISQVEGWADSEAAALSQHLCLPRSSGLSLLGVDRQVYMKEQPGTYVHPDTGCHQPTNT